MSELNKLQNIKIDEPLAPYTTFKIGGPARYFLEVKDIEELKSAIRAAGEDNLPVFVLSGGSNILVADEGFAGLVIKIDFDELKISADKITAGAGVNLNKLLMFSVNNNLSGLEWAAGIPGTLGGAIRGNAGAWGGEIKDIVESVEVLRNGEIVILDNKSCGFSYRHSDFKNNGDIILRAVLNLKPGDKEASNRKIQEYLTKKTQGQDVSHPTAGCMFKNVYLDKLDGKEKERVSAIVREEFSLKGIIPAGWLIEQCGLKGQIIGGARVSIKHANFILNQNKATAKDILNLTNLIKEKVFAKFGLRLEEEVQFIGF
ncbi:MAG: UDP-N-acetylmuramate dehydrogenase [Patescibacteria group bacterium]|nr:UDP-N-acetylmuramate dehydrogenase [Patescibacteria group bacterium]MDD5490526.1 UDP-N-acetylmuramate dehydrogenase [Patescibacteria group bacterium]